MKQGWWALANLLDDKDRQLHCLKQVLKLDPANKEARAKLEELQGAPFPGEPAHHVPSPSDSQETPAPRVTKGRNKYVYIVVAVVGVALVGALLTWLVASGALQGLFGGGKTSWPTCPLPRCPQPGLQRSISRCSYQHSHLLRHLHLHLSQVRKFPQPSQRRRYPL